MGEIKNNEREIKPAFMSKQELAALYGLSRSTIQRYCRMIKIETEGKLLSPNNVRKFIEHFGMP